MNIEVFCGAIHRTLLCPVCSLAKNLKVEPEGSEGFFVGIEKEFVRACAVLAILAFRTLVWTGYFDG